PPGSPAGRGTGRSLDGGLSRTELRLAAGGGPNPARLEPGRAGTRGRGTRRDVAGDCPLAGDGGPVAPALSTGSAGGGVGPGRSGRGRPGRPCRGADAFRVYGRAFRGSGVAPPPG